jgi:elongation factor G
MKALSFGGAEGEQIVEGEVPADLEETARRLRHDLEEKVAETDDALMERYLEGTVIDATSLRRGLRQAVMSGVLQPVFCGSALKKIGVQPLLDAVVDYLPSPLERPPIEGFRSVEDPERRERREPDRSAPLAAMVFKIVAEKPLDLHYVRVYSGTFKSGMRVVNGNTGKKENISRMFRMFAKRREQISSAGPGEIVACVGLKDALTGHTLCEGRAPIILERIEFPTPVISVSVEPKSTRDRTLLGEVLGKLERQDPTFKHTFDKETGQTIISGMGELHLEVLAHKLEREFGVGINVGRPLVAYREAITRPGEGEGRLIRQTGNRPQFAVVRMRVEPFVAQRHLHLRMKWPRTPSGPNSSRPLNAACGTACRSASWRDTSCSTCGRRSWAVSSGIQKARNLPLKGPRVRPSSRRRRRRAR